MNIALLANVDKELSLDTKGGSELFTYLLSANLARHQEVGHIHVFGVGNNHFEDRKITFHSLLPTETRRYVRDNASLSDLLKERPEAYTQIEDVLVSAMASQLLILKDEIDIIHNNSTSAVFSALLTSFGKPVLTTLHTNADSPSITIPSAMHVLPTGRGSFFAAIANHQRQQIAKHRLDLPILATVYNGIDIGSYPFADNRHESGGLWIGRVSRKHNKGLKEAVLASEMAGQNLAAMAFIDDGDYYENEIKPHLTARVNLSLADTTFDQKKQAYQNAKYFLYPIMWEEPFGLIFLEAMASGTPVIAYARGAVPEIIEDGKTGFIVNPDNDIRGNWTVQQTGLGGLVEAIKRINSLSPEAYSAMRKNCRKLVEDKFTAGRMVADYLNLYKQILTTS